MTFIRSCQPVTEQWGILDSCRQLQWLTGMYNKKHNNNKLKDLLRLTGSFMFLHWRTSDISSQLVDRCFTERKLRQQSDDSGENVWCTQQHILHRCSFPSFYLSLTRCWFEIRWFTAEYLHRLEKQGHVSEKGTNTSWVTTRTRYCSQGDEHNTPGKRKYRGQFACFAHLR